MPRMWTRSIEKQEVVLAAGTRTPVPRVRVLYPNHLDHSELVDNGHDIAIHVRHSHRIPLRVPLSMSTTQITPTWIRNSIACNKHLLYPLDLK